MIVTTPGCLFSFASNPAIIRGLDYVGHWDGRRAHFFLLLRVLRAVLDKLLADSLSQMGYELVDWEMSPGRLLRVFIDKPEGITVDDCVFVSNHFSRLLVVENVDYSRLEVSSPGLDRPLRKLADFQRYAGEQAKFQLHQLVENRRKLVGRIVAATEDGVVVALDSKEMLLPLALIDKARLVPRFD